MKDSRIARKVVRTLWWLATCWLPRRKSALLAYSLPTLKQSNRLFQLIACYQQVFREGWAEEHASSTVERRLAQEVGDYGASTVLTFENEVVGFAWGSALTPTVILARFAREHSLFPAQAASLQQALLALPGRPLYEDELGILRSLRGGPWAIRNLVLPLLEAFPKADGLVYWTAKKIGATGKSSPAYSFIGLLGAEIIWEGLVGSDTLVFAYLPNFGPLMKAFQRLDDGALRRILRFTARLSGQKRGQKRA